MDNELRSDYIEALQSTVENDKYEDFIDDLTDEQFEELLGDLE